jgi:hypothetical protein
MKSGSQSRTFGWTKAILCQKKKSPTDALAEVMAELLFEKLG